MQIIEHFAVSNSDGDMVLAKLAPGKWGVYWSDAPSLAPVGYALHEYDNEQEAMSFFQDEARVESERRK